MSDHNDDNYERAYENREAEPITPTPVHGYWRSLAELDGTAAWQLDPALRDNELPPIPQVSDPLSRRNFFQLMGASMALAGVATGCRYEKEEIVPLARRPEDLVPGTTMQYATAFELGGAGHALIASSYEGRPIKLDGNPEHPFASGAIIPAAGANQPGHAGCSTFAQASILQLYDPDRSQTVLNKTSGTSIDALRDTLNQLRAAGMQNIRVLSEGTSSPTLRRLAAQLATKGVGWHEYEPISWDNERTGMKLAFEQAVRPLAKLDQAETIVCLDCDIFVDHPAAMRYSRDWARSRRLDGTLGIGKMNRLWSIESTLSNTGAMADHRLALRSELGLPIAMYLDQHFGGGSTVNAAFLGEPKVKAFLDALVQELDEGKAAGKAVVIAGRKQPPAVHALVARINEKLGAVGKTLEYVADPDLDRPHHVESIAALARDMGTNKVEALVILGGNPVYDAPADLDFATKLAAVKTSIHLSEFVNETSTKTTWHVPKAHFLEAWGDVRTWDGTITIAQPLIAPLYGGLSSIELVSLLIGAEARGDVLVQDTMAELGIINKRTFGVDPSADARWRQAVHDGFVAAPDRQKMTPAVKGAFALPPLTASQAGRIDPEKPVLEVTFCTSPFSWDGRFANNAWLQETPDFLTKVTWDNYALVGPDTAEKLGLKNDTMIHVKVDNRDVEIACHVIPGQARWSIGLVLGGGRTHAGRVGGSAELERRVGWDTMKVRSSGAFDIAQNATATPADKKYMLSSVQEHWDIRSVGPHKGGLSPDVELEQIQRAIPEIIRETTANELVRNKDYKAEEEGVFWDDSHVNGEGNRRGLSLFKEHAYQGHRWAMAIDLTTCTGCNSCMVACQSENNVPVVGRKEILNNREMHWIRIDRYFSGSKEDPIVVHQPVACQQCENAPCEQVCPVGATSHSEEGLNDQAYNRCIGTRYCANNCPYKVRKFNFLDWNKEWREARNKVRRLLFNPEVTVRMRGVMEKCTFCVQRIENAKIVARAQARNERPGDVNAPLPDGSVVTACQQACPTEAIVFGDLSDPNSRVARAHRDRRHYDLLEELYTKPRNKYLAKVRNPNTTLVPPKSPASKGQETH